VAWVVQGLGSLILTSIGCRHPEARAEVRGGLAALDVVALAVTLAAIRIAWVAHRRVSGGAPLVGEEAEARSRLLATGGVFLAITLGLGILWATLPIAMLGGLCEAVR